MKKIRRIFICVFLVGFISSCDSSTVEEGLNPLAMFSYDLMPVSMNDTWGYINREGRYEINPQFDYALPFDSSELAVVISNDLFGYINQEGRYEINPQFELAFPFWDSELALVMNNGKYGFINKSGLYEITPQFDDATPFDASNLSLVLINGKYGFIDSSGRFVINPQFDDALPFSTSELTSVLVDGKVGYINKQGQYVINPQFEDGYPFSDNGLALVIFQGKVGYINFEGKFIINPIYDMGTSFFAEEGVAIIYEYSSDTFAFDFSYGLISDTGEIILNPTDGYSLGFSEGYAAIYNNDSVGFINKYGDYLINPIYENAYNFINGYTVVTNKDSLTQSIINTQGEIVIGDNLQLYALGLPDLDFEFMQRLGGYSQSVFVSSEGLIPDSSNVNIGVLNLSGLYEINPVYTSIYPYYVLARMAHPDNVGGSSASDYLGLFETSR
jgi:hypothetical protein